MPTGIQIINHFMRKYPFRSVAELDDLIDRYFKPAEPEENSGASTQQAKRRHEPEPPTMSGLAYYLGFESIREYDACETKGKYAAQLKRARLRVETEYEKKLHFQSSTGAIFALKSMGWNERITGKPAEDAKENVLKVEIVNSGPEIAGNERDVIL
jgi:hypothetical protein